MKTIIIILTLFTGILLLNSCEKYLDKTPYSEVTESDIFSTYESFQGFMNQLYPEVINYNTHGIASSLDGGGDIISNNRTGTWGNTGDYWAWLAPTSQGIFQNTGEWGWGKYSVAGTSGAPTSGIWTNSWRALRTTNVALKNLPLLTNATAEEKDLIKGQAYFFRAFFHWEIIRSFGGMPYIDTVFSPSDPLNRPRLSYQESTDRLVEDLDLAASLLPENWDDTDVGAQRPGANIGRPTKGAALAFKAKALLYAGSPAMNGFSGNTFAYNNSYMERAAAAAAEVIKIANKGVYTLIPFSEYRDMFARKDVNTPWTSETLFAKIPQPGGDEIGRGALFTTHGRMYNPSRFGGNSINQTPNQNYVDRFEMADGTRYRVEYDNNNALRWDFRDPRFRQNIIVDRDQWGFHANTIFRMYVGGTDKGSTVGMFTPYVIKKFWPIGVNGYDGEFNNFKFIIPHMRLADVYLIYAEAVNEAYGPNGTAPGLALTAVDAINLIRARAEQPTVTSSATGYSNFRELVWNERCVELCFEGNYWFDIRRWYVGHLPEYKDIVDLQFNQAWTSFNRVIIQVRVFENPKHYWMPIPRDQTLIYKEFNQNPGW